MPSLKAMASLFIYSHQIPEMKKVLVLLPVIALLASCYPKQQWLRDTLDKKEKALFQQSKAGRADTSMVNALLRDFQSYAAKYPSDSAGAEFLFKAAAYYRFMGQPQKSIDLYGKVYTNYPGIGKRPYALFLQGFTYENEMGNIEAAKAKYQQFLDTYPDHPFAKDVQATINNLGKTPEQLIAEFEAKQHAADSTAQVTK